jgi:hypothetical protein
MSGNATNLTLVISRRLVPVIGTKSTIGQKQTPRVLELRSVGGRHGVSDTGNPLGKVRLAAMLQAFFKIPPFGILALIAGLLGNGIVVASEIPLLMLAPGTSIRPMGWAALMFLVALVTLIVGLPSSLISFKSCSKRVSFVALLLSLTPLPLASVLLHLIARICGLDLAP